ncbi:ABC transporter permease [Virgibacillus phasianinus]|uniref:ABC transporter permease n=1 Tax=Virgibacillus phasianinus TaxID=2017483 RepID=A0A220TYE9_9BACI|nr:ABC transporter permease [Virgibacillus phasianinus]ASK60711.1 ABC transporter permease [Virgibacillus phasianinus]
MTILQIAWKEIKHDFRDIRTLVFMLGFPIVLMFVLGTALTGAFNGDFSIDEMNVVYNNTNDELTQPFKEFTKGAAQSGIHFTQVEDGKNGKDLVEQGEADGYVSIDQTGFHLFINDRSSIEGSILQGTLASFVDRYNVMTEVTKAAPEKAGSVLQGKPSHDYIDDHSLLPSKKPGSMDYYAVVMTTMIALYGAMAASGLISGERSRNTASRLMVAPIHKRDIFIGKVLGSIGINLACIAVVVLFSKLVFHVNWGDHYGMVFLVLVTEVILAVSFGLGISFFIKSQAGPTVIIMIAIQLASFFGGAYFPIENPEGIVKIIANLSPLTLENAAMFDMIYANDLSSVVPAVGMNLGIAFVFLLITTVFLRRREGL